MAVGKCDTQRDNCWHESGQLAAAFSFVLIGKVDFGGGCPPRRASRKSPRRFLPRCRCFKSASPNSLAWGRATPQKTPKAWAREPVPSRSKQPALRATAEWRYDA